VQEGYVTLSIDGRVLTLGCYNVPVGSPAPYASAAQRVIARIFGNASVDTSIGFSDALQSPNIFTSVVSLDGQARFWLSGAPYAGSDIFTASATPRSGNTGGVWYTTGQPGSASISLYNQFPVKALTIFQNGLYVGVS
jgi:hypothetical protein